MGAYVEDFLNWVDGRRKSRDERYSQYAKNFYVSSLGSCPRKQVLQRASVAGRPMTREKARFFEDRTALHNLRVQGAWEMGRALTADLDVDGASRGFSLTKYMPEHFGGRPDVIGHQADPSEAEFLRGCWSKMVTAYDQGEGWERYRDILREAGVDVTDWKTSRPGAVKFYGTFPKSKDIGQTGWYAHVLNDVFDLGIKQIRLVYAAIGSEIEDLEFEIPLPSKEALGIAKDCEDLVSAWTAFQNDKAEDPWQRELPSILPLLAEVVQGEKYKRQGIERTRNAIFLKQNWQCGTGYCQYSGCGCEPLKTVLKGGDRIGVVREDGVWQYVGEWCRKAGFLVPDDAVVVRERDLDPVETANLEQTSILETAEVE